VIGRQLPERLDQVGTPLPGVRPEMGPELGRDGESARRRKCFTHVRIGEHGQCLFVHQVRPDVERQYQHHVGEVDRPPPTTGTNLAKGDVNQHQVAILHQEIGRLQVAMGQPGIPQPADDSQTLIDDLRPHFRLIDNSVTIMYSRPGMICTTPSGFGDGRPASRMTRSM